MGSTVRTALLFFAALLLMGCATKLFIPGNRFITPESNGGIGHMELRHGALGVTDVTVADRDTDVAPDTTPVLIKNSAMGLGGQMGLIPRIDGYFNYVFGAPMAAGGKIQILGSSMREAKKGNFSLAIAGGAIFGHDDHRQTEAGVEGRSQLTYSGYEGMALMGYRLSDWTLFYLGASAMKMKAKIETQLTVSGVTTITSNPDGEGESKGATAGLRVGKFFFVNLEAALTETVWKRVKPTVLESKKFSNLALGCAIGGMW